MNIPKNQKEEKTITKLELIEYLKHTPENTNYNILYSSLYNGSNKEIVDEFIEVLSRENLSLAALQPYLAKLYEDDKTISPDPLPPFSSGSSSVPKPLTYDYMPEGYPSKSVQTTTLMEEQELAFALEDDTVYATYPNEAPEIVEGQTYTVNWDGTEYECVCAVFTSTILSLGNKSIYGVGDDTGEPFLYIRNQTAGEFVTLDTSASHTISVKTIDETVIPITEKFLPESVAPKSDVEAAQTTANAAKNTAESAQATANAAKNTAESAQAAANAAAAKKNPVFTGSFSQNRKKDSVIGYDSHAEGFSTIASGQYSHAEGDNTTASGNSSHAEGNKTTASGNSSHAEGYDTKAISDYQHVQGKFNIKDSSNTYAHIVGNGSSDTSRSNAHTLDWSGNAWFAGTVEGTALIIPSSTEGSTKKFKITVDDSGAITATEVT